MSRTTTKNWRVPKTIDGLRRRYEHLPPLLFQRTIERATGGSEAFDILESVPNAYPVVWDDHLRQWVTPADMWLDPGKGQ